MKRKITGILLILSMCCSFPGQSFLRTESVFAEGSEPVSVETTGELTGLTENYSMDGGNLRADETVSENNPSDEKPITYDQNSSDNLFVSGPNSYEDNSSNQDNPTDQGNLSDQDNLPSTEWNPDLQENSEDQIPSEEELLGEITEGRVLALAPIALTADASAALQAEAPEQYRVENIRYLDVDEVTKWELYREVIYLDCDGVERRSPLYCMEADLGGMPSATIKEEAVRVLSDSAIRKLLYFGYGGPGDICDSYDPSCGHVNWNKMDNRYIFTHMALSKVYSGQYGDSNEWEYEHTGVNRFINKILSMTIPARDGLVFSSNNGTDVSQTARELSINLRYFRKIPSDCGWLDTSLPGFDKGVYNSFVVKLADTANAGNSIFLTRTPDTEWQIGYWLTKAEYNERGRANPRVPQIGETIELKNGNYFLISFPGTIKGEQTVAFRMNLKPVYYLLIDGSIQTGKENIQEFGAYVYQGERGIVSMKAKPCPLGSVKLVKKDSRSGNTLPGATYKLYAAEDMIQFSSVTYRKDSLVDQGVTNEKGEIVWDRLLTGKYYVVESAAPEGYLLDTEKHEITVREQENVLSLKDIPDLKADVEIRKKDSVTGRILEDAEFTVYSWSRKQNKYINGIRLIYDSERELYSIQNLVYTEDNEGWYKVVETQNPKGYSGTFSKEISMSQVKAGEKMVFSYDAVNDRVTWPYVEIRKIAADTEEILADAVFQIYEWNQTKKKYQDKGTALTFQPDSQKYVSGELKESRENMGRFLIRETRNPEGFIGQWEQEIQISDQESSFSFTVKNEREKIPVARIQVEKKDSLTEEALAGAVFAIYEWDEGTKSYGTEPYNLIWNAESRQYLSEDLPLTRSNSGKYKIVEQEAPVGYEGDWSKEITLTYDGEIRTLEVFNDRIMGELTVVKRIREADIIWAHGNPSFQFVVEGNDLNGIFHRWEKTVTYYADSFETESGGYAIQETIFTAVPPGEYRIYEKPVLRYYLKQVTANTNNVAVRPLSGPGYGKLPENTYDVSAVISAQTRSGRVTFTNEKSRYDGFSHTDVCRNTISVRFDQD